MERLIDIVSFGFVSRVESKSLSICAGCNCHIHDQYLLRVAPDLEWHIQCLKCAECGQSLDETRTCFVLDGKTYCKSDYTRYVSLRSIKDFDLKKLSQAIIISAAAAAVAVVAERKINTLQKAYVSSRQTTLFDKRQSERERERERRTFRS